MIVQSVAPENVYSLAEPDLLSSASVFSSPHSGADYPQELVVRSHLDRKTLRSSEDAYVDELFGTAPLYGAPLLAARMPRAWIDLNRAAEELDPALVAGAPKSPRSPRICAGLGVIPRVVSESRVIMHGKISLAEAERRIRAYYNPYHERLDALMQRARNQFGYGLLIDCHSMPRDALTCAPRIAGHAPDIVLGDRFGASCGRWVVEAAMSAFDEAGFRVARNAPFAGGYITQKFGKPSRNLHALQIEIDRSVYMHESTLAKRPEFDEVTERLSKVISTLSRLVPDGGVAVAAE